MIPMTWKLATHRKDNTVHPRRKGGEGLAVHTVITTATTTTVTIRANEGNEILGHNHLQQDHRKKEIMRPMRRQHQLPLLRNLKIHFCKNC